MDDADDLPACGRIGVFGGTFDPIHLAHLALAERVRETLELDRVLFVPAAVPPHKLDAAITPGKLRLEMVEIAIASNPAFAADDLELRRSGPSYTVDTVRSLAQRHGGCEFFLAIGGDSLAEFPTWRDPAGILEHVRLAVIRRPGSPTAVPAGIPADKVTFVEAPLLEIASRDLRARVAAGRSIRYLVPAAVEAFIRAHRLYRAERPGR
jgi:nicotinate-nucleotide adenylyltransferase